MSEIGLPEQKQEQWKDEDTNTNHEVKSNHSHPRDFVELQDHELH